MKKVERIFFTIVSIFVLMSFPVEAQSGVQNWQVFTFEEGGLSFSMPGKPQEVKQNVDGQIQTTFVYQTPDKGIIYSATFSPTCPLLTGQDVSDFFRGVADAAQNEPNEQLISRRDISFEGSPGIEIVAISPQRWLEHYKWYLVGTRSISLSMSVRDEKTIKATQADRTKFFDSLKLTPSRRFKIAEANVQVDVPFGFGKVAPVQGQFFPGQLKISEDCGCLAVFFDTISAQTFESAFQKSIAYFYDANRFNYSKTNNGSFKNMAYTDYVGTEGTSKTFFTHYEIRIIKVSNDRFFVVAGYFADIFNANTPLSPAYKSRLSNLFQSVLRSVEKVPTK